MKRLGANCWTIGCSSFFVGLNSFIYIDANHRPFISLATLPKLLKQARFGRIYHVSSVNEDCYSLSESISFISFSLSLSTTVSRTKRSTKCNGQCETWDQEGLETAATKLIVHQNKHLSRSRNLHSFYYLLARYFRITCLRWELKDACIPRVWLEAKRPEEWGRGCFLPYCFRDLALLFGICPYCFWGYLSLLFWEFNPIVLCILSS